MNGVTQKEAQLVLYHNCGKTIFKGMGTFIISKQNVLHTKFGVWRKTLFFSFPLMSVFSRVTSSCVWILASFVREATHESSTQTVHKPKTRPNGTLRQNHYCSGRTDGCCPLNVHLGDSASCLSVSPVSILINNTSHRQQTRRGAHDPPLHLATPTPPTKLHSC